MTTAKTSTPRKRTSRTVKNKVNTATVTPKVMLMRRQGHSMRHIAEKLKISLGMVHKIVTKSLSELAKEGREETELYRQLQIERYESLLIALIPSVKDGIPQAVGEARKVLDSLNKVTGAELPTKVAPTNPDGTKEYDPAAKTEDERLKRIAELMSKPGLLEKLGQNDN